MDDKEEDSMVKQTCQVCFEEHSMSKFIALDCGHEYCQYCVLDSIVVKIESGKVD